MSLNHQPESILPVTAMKSFARSLRYSRIASVAIVLLLQLDGYARAITIDDCSGDGTVAKLTHVDIENCGEKDEFCPFVKGRNATTEIAFHTSKTRNGPACRNSLEEPLCNQTNNSSSLPLMKQMLPSKRPR